MEYAIAESERRLNNIIENEIEKYKLVEKFISDYGSGKSDID